LNQKLPVSSSDNVDEFLFLRQNEKARNRGRTPLHQEARIVAGFLNRPATALVEGLLVRASKRENMKDRVISFPSMIRDHRCKNLMEVRISPPEVPEDGYWHERQLQKNFHGNVLAMNYLPSIEVPLSIICNARKCLIPFSEACGNFLERSVALATQINALKGGTVEKRPKFFPITAPLLYDGGA